jgi:hypothetical protein
MLKNLSILKTNFGSADGLGIGINLFLYAAAESQISVKIHKGREQAFVVSTGSY